MLVPENKDAILDEASEKVKFIQKKHWQGFLTTSEKTKQSITIWAAAKKVIENEIK
jgi:DNA-directed RNA polymerase beta' subunit